MEAQHRDMVFCHECENEWFRDEHGLSCPDCHSDFTEIIEAQHDPRSTLDDTQENPLHGLHDHNPWEHTPHDAPDPDEDDINQFHWHHHQPGGIQMSFSHTFDGRTRDHDPSNPPHVDPMMQTFASMLNTIVGGAGGRPGQQLGDPTREHHNTSQPGQEPGVHVFTGGGANFRYTATTRLQPRDANGPQPPPQVMEDLPNLLQSVFQGPARGAGPDPAFAPMGPLAGLFANIFNPANMQHGDAVYSQEALDRIVSQLMEQTQNGNAPGPASAEAIASLPQKTITKGDVDETTGKADCSICMDEAVLGATVTSLPCGHWFHGECIKAWLSEHDTCPHCRQGIMPKDGPDNATNARSPGQAPRHDQNWAQQQEGQGTQTNPFVVPESPPRQRRASNSGSTGGLFSRMREAFGGGGGGASGSSSGSNNGGNSGGAGSTQ